MAYLADENFPAARDSFEDALDELEDPYTFLEVLVCKETEVDTPLAARCLSGLGVAYNGCGDAEAALEPLQAARSTMSCQRSMARSFSNL